MCKFFLCLIFFNWVVSFLVCYWIYDFSEFFFFFLLFLFINPWHRPNLTNAVTPYCGRQGRRGPCPSPYWLSSLAYSQKKEKIREEPLVHVRVKHWHLWLKLKKTIETSYSERFPSGAMRLTVTPRCWGLSNSMWLFFLFGFTHLYLLQGMRREEQGFKT